MHAARADGGLVGCTHDVFVSQKGERDVVFSGRGHALEVPPVLLRHRGDDLKLATLHPSVDVAEEGEDGGPSEDCTGGRRSSREAHSCGDGMRQRAAVSSSA